MDGTTPFNPVLTRPLQVRFDRPSVRTAFQFKGTITPKESKDQDIFAAAVNLALKWVKSRVPEPFPGEAWEGESFNVSMHDEHVECIVLREEAAWSLRWTHPDKPFNGDDPVPGRTWVNDIGIRRVDNNQCLVAVRLQCASRAYATEDIALTRPKIVLNFANEFTLAEAHEVSADPWIMESEDDLERLESLLTSPDRTMPVYVLTQPDQSRLQRKTAPFLLDHVKLARHTQGMAYVVALPWELGFKWTKKVGKTWSTFHGAVRTYMPGLNFDEDSPSAHPLALAERILWFKHGDSKSFGEAEFLEFLVEQAHQHAASKQMDWGDCLFVTEARTRRAEIARASASEDADWKAIYEEQIEALKGKNAELSREIDGYLDLATLAERESNYYRKENQKLRAQIEALRMQLESKTGESADTLSDIPTSYDEVPDWVDSAFAGRLELHPRAIRGLKKAVYEDISLVCQAIQALAREYRNMRLGHADGLKTWESKLAELGLEMSGSITESRAGEKGETYFVNYPPHTTQRRYFENHLRRGNSRDQRHCLRIYFFWHSESQQVVIGWLPSHLDTRIT